MPKNENMVEWCLNKAQKEIEKGQKHRGLVKTKPDMETAHGHVKKAEHNFDVFMLNRKHGAYDWCISMGFYTMYHCCLAISAKFGYESRNQECTLSLMSMLSEQGKLGENFHSYLEAMKAGEEGEDQILALREKYQYSPTISLDKQVVERLRLLCIDMITETKWILK